MGKTTMRVTLMARYYDADIPPLPYYPESVVGQIVLLVAAPHELYLALPWLDVALLGKLLLLPPCFSQLLRLVIVAVAPALLWQQCIWPRQPYKGAAVHRAAAQPLSVPCWHPLPLSAIINQVTRCASVSV